MENLFNYGKLMSFCNRLEYLSAILMSKKLLLPAEECNYRELMRVMTMICKRRRLNHGALNISFMNKLPAGKIKKSGKFTKSYFIFNFFYFHSPKRESLFFS